MQVPDAALWEWSIFWQSDQLQSCMPANNPDACDMLFATWRDFFNALPSGARILDLGTGNGSVTTQAVMVSQTKPVKFSIHGVDLAEIEPARFVLSASELLKEVTFHPRTPMEALPFTDNYFDAVSSQYALEYSQTHKSLPEALRVLRPGGCFRFLLHADNGVLKSRCQMQRQQAETILESKLFPCLTHALEKILKAQETETPQTMAAAERAITALKGVLDDLEHSFSGIEDRSLVDNLFAAVRRLPGLRQSYNLGTLVDMAANIERLLIAQAKRLQAMENAALDEAAVTELANQLRNTGAQDVKLEQATSGTHNTCVGYCLYGNKSASRT